MGWDWAYWWWLGWGVGDLMLMAGVSEGGLMLRCSGKMGRRVNWEG